MAAQTRAEPKSIVLFSDGTGNSSAKLFKTNVWRMYEAIDLGPSPAGKRDQISFYDDGVGTSNFKVFAALGGAVGWGLKRNVLDLYRYACRNYRKGDRIYAFGFSRGAFTIRVVIALIASQGLVQSSNETELNRRSLQAYRAFRSTFHIRKLKWISRITRRLRARSTTYRRRDNLHPKIHFVGVWDTVAAYGGPIAEITRAIDNWIYPLSMPDYKLDEDVLCARHALAIDDERDAFQPLLWDELSEDRRANRAAAAQKAALRSADETSDPKEKEAFLAEAKAQAKREELFRTRMQQVWFTGMHADVGGGYPDESLSYVSLLWMMEAAENAGLRTLASIKDRYFALANSYGPMHDSRSGLGSYYRYQPRKIAAWVDAANEADSNRYLMLRDPAIRNGSKNPRGLLRSVCVHESVIARIDSGTVRYAPIALPESFKVIPPQRAGETIEQPVADPTKGKCKYELPPSDPLIAPATRQLVEQPSPERFSRQENLWDLVWKRRIGYFATVSVTLLLVALPVRNVLPAFVDQTCSDLRCLLPSLIGPMKSLVPGFADPWITAMAAYPGTLIVLALAIWGLRRWNGSLAGRLSDGSYELWHDLFSGQPITKQNESPLRKFREGARYQKFFKFVKWSLLPAIFGILMLLAILYAPLVAISQAVIQVHEADHYFCPDDDPKQLHKVVDLEAFVIDASSPCNSPNLIIETNQAYDLVFQLPVTEKGDPAPWWDDLAPSKPGSLTRIRASGFFQVLGVPSRRVIEASYLQPLAQTVRMEPKTPYRWEPDWFFNWRSQFRRVHITRLALKQDEEWPELYRVRFMLRSEPDKHPTKYSKYRVLHLFSNEASPLFLGRTFYNNNCGTALVSIIKVVPLHHGQKALKIEEPSFDLPVPQCSQDQARQKLLQKTEVPAD